MFVCECNFSEVTAREINIDFFIFIVNITQKITYAFQSESTLHSCLTVKELLARNKHDI